MTPIGSFSVTLLPALAEAGSSLMAWTPRNFYVAAAIAQSLIIWVGYRLLGAEAQYNTVVGAVACAAVGNVIAFFARDYAVLGFAATSLGYYVLLLLSSGIDLFRSLLVFILVIGSYGGLGKFVSERSSLDAYDIGGVPKTIMTGGFQPQPLERKKDESVPDLDKQQ